MLTYVQLGNDQDQVYTFQCIYLESSQTHQKAIKYLFKQIDHDIHQGFLFQIH